MTIRLMLAIAVAFSAAAVCHAHDTWVQTHTNLVRVRDSIHVDLLLGNHGNDHRDFKLAGKPDLDGATLEVVLPDGTKLDLKPGLADTGYAPQEGFWTTRFTPAEAGLYVVGHTSDKIMSYAPVRSVKCGKTCFVASGSLDKVSQDNPGFNRVLGHPLELVPLSNPVTPMGPGTPLRVQLLFDGKPLADTRVSFIPRGETLATGTDDRYERTTDAKGEASFTPTFGNYYLIVAHREEPQQKGKGYEKTKYSATLTLFVPQICPCCND